MMGTMMRLGLSSSMLRSEDLYPQKCAPRNRIKDMTEMVRKMMFPKIPNSRYGQVILISSILVAHQGTGKSETMKHDAWTCLQTYGEENVEIIHADSYKLVLENMTGTKPVVFAIVDDALRNQNGRRSMSGDSVDMVAEFNETRHRFEKVSAGRQKNAVIIIECGIQRWNALDVTFRTSADIVRFKSTEMDEDDAKRIKNIIGPNGLNALERIGMRNTRDNSFKTYSVCRIGNWPMELGVGITRSGFMYEIDPTFELPEMLRTPESEDGAEVAPRKQLPKNTLEEIRAKAPWKYEAYQLSKKGLTQQEIADYVADTHGKCVQRTSVSGWIKQIEQIEKGVEMSN